MDNYKEKTYNIKSIEYLLFYTQDENGTMHFGKWVKKSQYERKKKLKRLKKVMKNEIQN